MGLDLLLGHRPDPSGVGLPGGVVVRHTAVYLEWIAFMLLELAVPITIRKPAALWELLQRIARRAARIEAAVEGDVENTAIRFKGQRRLPAGAAAPDRYRYRPPDEIGRVEWTKLRFVTK